MTLNIRLATPDDAEPLADLNNRIWPDIPTTPARAAQITLHPDHAPLIATQDGAPVGFAESFSLEVAHRSVWEIDLLAVAPEARGHGLATRLIRQSVWHGQQAHATQCRAVVRLGNTPAERAFAAAGFTPTVPMSLMVAEPAPQGLTAMVINPTWRVVETLTYRGLWAEYQGASSFFKALRSTAYQEGCHSVGLLVPQTEADALDQLSSLGFEPIGAYRRWLYALVG